MHVRLLMGTALAVATVSLCVPSSADGQQGRGAGEAPAADTASADSIPVHRLEGLVVRGRSDDLTGVAVTASQGATGRRDFRLRPLAREGELLETVPGMIVTQHSGDGKSNQMFVRGFNLDHGTDFATRVEGMPVNLPTHGHGQGYTDLHFVVPELVERVEYRLGTYYADVGDFGSAGTAHLRLRHALDRPLARLEGGELGHRRLLGAASTGVGAGELLVGGELRRYDGPWEVPQDLRKASGLARWSWTDGRDAVSILGMGYDGEWRASDQIPRRLVASAEASRFAQVDSTLGGASSRYSLSARWTRRTDDGGWRADLYGIRYDLDLYSNFTYFLDDPGDGDQIRQEDDGRTVLGGEVAHLRTLGSHEVTVGLQGRRDRVEPSLRRTRSRELLEPVREDDVTQWSAGAHVEVESRWSPWFRSVLGLRADRYHFDVTARRAANSGTADAGIVSPKASLVFAPGGDTEIYLSAGRGFHSNDGRGVVQSVDPATGDPADPVDALVPSRGAEVGLRTAPTTSWRSTLTAWGVELDSELLFEGDAGTTAPSDGSRRLGVTWTNFYGVTPELSADLDVSLVRARFHEAPDAENRVPGALENVVTAGLTWDPEGSGPDGALRLRRFGSHPLTEDGEVRADPTSLLALNAGWSAGALRLEVGIMNLLDAEAADVQYHYRSRLPGEPAAGVPDVHFHPVEPRRVRVGVSWGG